MKSFDQASREVLASPVFIFLAVLTIGNAYGFQSWRTLLNNFIVEVGALDGFQNGIVQSVREVPGFLSLLVIYVLLVMRQQRLAGLSILIIGVGVAAAGFFPSFHGVLLTTLLMSFGFHYYEATAQALVLQHFDKGISPWVLGKQRSYTAGANLVVGIIIFFAASRMDYASLFLLFGLPVVLVGAWGMLKKPLEVGGGKQIKKLVLRRRYAIFYMLTFLNGGRRQVFVAFAVFLAVERFGYSLEEVTGLFVLNNLITFFVSPWVGRAIMRFGERNVLVFEYASLFFVFLGYAFAANKLQVAALYILDHLFFNFRIAISTYFHKVADPRDIAPTVAVSFTINHIAAVIVPALFGMFWLMDHRIPFVLGALMSLGSLGLALLVRIPTQKEPTEPAPKVATESPG